MHPEHPDVKPVYLLPMHRSPLDSTRTLGLISQRRQVRYWFNAYSQLVGIWQSKAGRTYAVGHNPRGECVFYRAIQAEWSHE